jgi:hypothetical protein
MNFKKITFLIVFISQFCIAQNVNFDIGEIKIKNYIEVINFEFVNEKIFIPITINSKVYRFMLDTGAPNMISKTVLNELNLSKKDSLNLTDANGQVQKLSSVVIPKINIGNLLFENQFAMVFDIENHNVLSCLNFDGIIGSNLFKNSILKIGFDKQQLTITDQIKILNLKTKPSKLKLVNTQKSPYVELNFKGLNGKKASDYVLFDTGMPNLYDMSIRAYKIFNEKNVFKSIGSSKGISSTGFFGEGEETDQYLVHIDDAMLNKFHFNNFNISTTRDNNSRIGLEFLKYGDVILDFKNEKFYFESNKSVDLENIIPKYEPSILDNKFVIALVWDENLKQIINSNDEIISIDDIIFKELSICEILKLKKEWKNKPSYLLKIKNKEGQISEINIEN